MEESYLFCGLGSIGKKLASIIKELRPTAKIYAYKTSNFYDPFLTEKNIEVIKYLEKALKKRYSAVFLTNPTSLHMPLAIKFAENGNNLFIEKPISNNIKDIDKLKKISEEKNLIIQIGYCLRYLNPIKKIKELLDTNIIGKIYFANAEYGNYFPNWRPNQDYKLSYSNKKELGGGIMLDMVHEIDYLIWFFGNPKNITSINKKVSSLERDTEDLAKILIEFENGVTGDVSIDCLQQTPTRTCKIVGEKGIIRWNAEWNHIKLLVNDDKGWKEVEAPFDAVKMYEDQMKDFLDNIDNNKKPLNSLEEGEKSLKVVVLAKDSYRTKKILGFQEGREMKDELKDLNIVCIICARGGSEGVPGKNVKLLNGKPLLAHTIETAKNCDFIDRVIISTDSEEIAEIGRKYGAEVPFIRPTEFATSRISKIPALQHAVEQLEKDGKKIDIIVDMDPTSPFRTVEDIKKCVMKLFEPSCDVVVTCYEQHLNPYFNMLEYKDDGFLDIVKKPSKIITARQDAPKVYQMNSAVFASWRNFLMKCESYFNGNLQGLTMPIERSLMIDTPMEFKIAELMMRENEDNNKVNKLFDLTGKIALVTGGTGFLGREHCKTLVGAGAKVILLDRQMSDDAEILINELNNIEPKVFFEKFEITDLNSVKEAVTNIIEKHGKIDILVNNVGYATNNADKGFHNTVEEYPKDIWDRVIEVNLTGTHNVTQQVLKQMITQKSGSIIIISSLYGNVSPDQRIYGNSGINAPIPYSAAKAGLINYARHLATHYAPDGIRVNVISPGGVYKGYGEDFKQAYSNKVPMGRMMNKEELHGPVLFFASNASSYITGQNLLVDGGWTAW